MSAAFMIVLSVVMAGTAVAILAALVGWFLAMVCDR